MVYRIRRPDGSIRESDSEPERESGHGSSGETESRWAQRTLREVLFEVYREQRRIQMWRNIWRSIAVLAFLAVFFGGRIGGGKDGEHPSTHKKAGGRHTAVVRLDGEIGGENDQTEILRKGMEAAYRNGNAAAIIIRANSPGGSPVVSNTAFAEIRRMKQQHEDIPVYVVAEDVCASGCYYIAAAADKIFADPSSLVGSIGVIGSSFDATGLMEKLGIKRRVRISGSNKGMGDPFSPETPEQQAIWQQMLDQIHAEFIKAVREGRGKRLHETEYPDLYSGRIFTGIEAQKAGLIDGFGSVYSVARDEINAPDLVDYTPEDDSLAALFSRQLGAQMQQQVQQWGGKVW